MRTLMATLLLAAVLPAQAEPVATPDRQKFRAYLTSAAYVDELARIGIYWDRTVLERQTGCDSQYEVEPMTFAVLDPPLFTADSIRPWRGIWRQKFGLTRCGEQAVYNVLGIAQDGKVQIQPQVPGESQVAPMLLSELIRDAVAVRSARLSDSLGECRRTAVADTQITLALGDREVGGEAAKNVWQETWTVKRCDSTFEMNFCFKQSPQGGIDWAPVACDAL